MSDSDRFWAKVDKTDECWLWTAGTNYDGYGQFWVDGKYMGAHRFSWELANGPISGRKLDHRCRVKRCVNPDHLRVLTGKYPDKQNGENRDGPQRNSTSGFRGVYFHKRDKKWRAVIQHYGKKISGGGFSTAAEANQSVIALRRKWFTHSDMDQDQP